MEEHATIIYRLPNDSIYYLIKGELKEYDPFNSSGHCIIAPFKFPESKAWMISTSSQKQISLSQFPEIKATISSPEIQQLNYQAQVQNAVEFIQSSDLEKVVISRIKPVDISEVSVSDWFIEMCKKYENAFVYLIRDKTLGIWMGATPELLLSSKGNNYKTIALAGTMKTDDYKKGNSWGNKEKNEQNFVSDYIIDLLTQKGVTELKKGEQKTLENGPVCHLCNDITFQYEGEISDIIQGLHPTPAVCGTPKDQAKRFIDENESHDRSMYTGFIGLNHVNNLTQIFVNLRCMQVFKNKMHLYLGAGITAKSIPLLELEETENKAGVLLSVVQKIGT